jgi:hypothetical protein
MSSVKEVLITEISNKFNWETDWGFIDDMKMAIIDTMILNHTSKININMNTNQRVDKELQVSIADYRKNCLRFTVDYHFMRPNSFVKKKTRY